MPPECAQDCLIGISCTGRACGSAAHVILHTRHVDSRFKVYIPHKGIRAGVHTQQAMTSNGQQESLLPYASHVHVR